MKLRIQRQPTRREKTTEEQLRDEEKFSMRVLEECRQIPKSDRLELRRHIKDNCLQVLDFFRRYKRNQNLTQLQVSLRKHISNYKQLQQKQLIETFKRSMENSRRCDSRAKANIKITDSNHNRGRSAYTSSRSVETRRDYSSTRALVKPFGESNCKGKQTPPPRITYHQPQEDSALKSELSQIEKQNISRLLARNDSSGFLSKTLLGSASSSCQITREFEQTQKPTVTVMPTPTFTALGTYRRDYEIPAPADISGYYSAKPSQGDLFTDPRILQECREILGRSTGTSVGSILMYGGGGVGGYSTVSYSNGNYSNWTQNNTYTYDLPPIAHISSPSHPSCSLPSIASPSAPSPPPLPCPSPPLSSQLLFSSTQAQPTMDFFFQPQCLLSKQSFTYRLQQLISKHHPNCQFSRESLQSYFTILSDDGVTISIGRFGRLLDDYCNGNSPMHELRKLWKQLDRSGYGCIGKEAVDDPKWQELFNRADTTKKGYIGYWELYGVRKSWEFISFAVSWKQENEGNREPMGITLQAGSFGSLI